jgi:hypothetical protein
MVNEFITIDLETKRMTVPLLGYLGRLASNTIHENGAHLD